MVETHFPPPPKDPGALNSLYMQEGAADSLVQTPDHATLPLVSSLLSLDPRP